MIFKHTVISKNFSMHKARWMSAVGDWLTIDFDGAVNKNRFTGCGGIIRNAQDDWLGGFSRNIGSCNAFQIELWGVLKGTLMA